MHGRRPDMELILIRHGEPDITLEDLSDPPLTPRGHAQAAATAAHLAETHLDAVYISPQQRAQQTAAPLLTNRSLAPVTDTRIAEFDYERGSYVTEADFAGMTREQALAELMAMQGPAFHARVAAGFDDIVVNNAGRTVAVVCHGGVISSVVKSVLEADKGAGADHASVTRIMASSSGVRSLVTFNERHWLDHLRPS